MRVRALWRRANRVIVRNDPWCGVAQETVLGRVGVEIGGPSRVFRRLGQWPWYGLPAACDGVDFASRTLWSGRDRSTPYRHTVVDEASQLQSMQAGVYEFIAASHVLEHLANPVAALARWAGLLGPGGAIIVVVPHKDGMFDHRRETTSAEHMWADYIGRTSEDDTTHFDEVLALHDFERDSGVSDRSEFVRRVTANASLRSVHHHVFVTESAVRLLDLANLRVVFVEAAEPYHVCIVARVPPRLADPRWPAGGVNLEENGRYLDQQAAWRRASPFPADRGRR